MHARFGAQWPAVSVESQLIRHRPGYFLGPHSDLHTKLVVLLIYLAPDENTAHLGTSLYRPKDPSFTCPNSTHYQFEDFINVKTAPYKPNSMLAFFRSDVSFHGLEPLVESDVQRQWARCDSVCVVRQSSTRATTSRASFGGSRTGSTNLSGPRRIVFVARNFAGESIRSALAITKSGKCRTVRHL